MIKQFFLVGCLLASYVSCKEKKPEIQLESPSKVQYSADTLKLSKEERYDKILGALVGSAIGDAMGASTEMWHRKDIQLKYGYIEGLIPAVRQQSPEGTWAHNLGAGATTDDTRWKYLMVKYLSNNETDKNATNFAKFITNYYGAIVETLSKTEMKTNPDLLDDQIEKMDWVKEWARVALAYQKNPEAYQKAQNRFYGGEMSCAGQLYTPMFGLTAKTPDEAYADAYEHTLFDLGYAKDISALAAAMTHMAMRTQNMDSILNTTVFVDPHGYQDSRLVGRIASATADDAIKNVLIIKQLALHDSIVSKDTLLFKMPKGFQDSQKEWTRQEMVYQILEKDKKAIAFHSGEIWQILITGMQFGDGDFLKTLQFIVNYGRDNDTVAAVAGMIMGAKEGYSKLPKDLRERVLKVNSEQFGIDLEALADELTNSIHNTL